MNAFIHSFIHSEEHASKRRRTRTTQNLGPQQQTQDAGKLGIKIYNKNTARNSAPAVTVPYTNDLLVTITSKVRMHKAAHRWVLLALLMLASAGYVVV